MSLIKTLEHVRTAQGLTQAELGERTGVARKTIVRIESGETDPRLSTIEAVARVMGMELVMVPKALRHELEAFIQSGGRALAQPVGADAPRSVVDALLNQKA
ncbi:helix-turn-helix transcriptional regulator [Rhodoferax mekongensis]|uniref:Helix-turn-helix transcriptional regulator n=1 Tax=Rhodoferax mekongensis TaxID=3068341 RepID=A0ABZ0AWF8_9BURK|nr:helix-turn-helix transcriptional regulator [Rhodoferax sp. TBRC 17307]WNO03981.1 helix-turn-helix transcriptional regulator [Rhodoferax sp. TBRC 17307]